MNKEYLKGKKTGILSRHRKPFETFKVIEDYTNKVFNERLEVGLLRMVSATPALPIPGSRAIKSGKSNSDRNILTFCH